MTLQQIINHVPEYKVIETGEIFEISTINYNYKTVKIFDKWLFWDQVQKLTPLSFNGERIGIGDTVNGRVVYDYFYSFTCADWTIIAYQEFNNVSRFYLSTEIISHAPLYPTKIKEVTMKEVEKKFGCKVMIIK